MIFSKLSQRLVTAAATTLCFGAGASAAPFEEGVEYQFIRCQNELGQPSFSANLQVDAGVVSLLNLPSFHHEPNVEATLYTEFATFDMSGFAAPLSGMLTPVVGEGEDGEAKRLEGLRIFGLDQTALPQSGLEVLVTYYVQGEDDVHVGGRTYQNCQINNKAMLLTLVGI